MPDILVCSIYNQICLSHGHTGQQDQNGKAEQVDSFKSASHYTSRGFFFSCRVQQIWTIAELYISSSCTSVTNLSTVLQEFHFPSDRHEFLLFYNNHGFTLPFNLFSLFPILLTGLSKYLTTSTPILEGEQNVPSTPSHWRFAQAFSFLAIQTIKGQLLSISQLGIAAQCSYCLNALFWHVKVIRQTRLDWIPFPRYGML